MAPTNGQPGKQAERQWWKGEDRESQCYEKVQTEMDGNNKEWGKRIAAVAAMCCISKCVSYGASGTDCQMSRQNGRKTLNTEQQEFALCTHFQMGHTHSYT